jgi:hypothetical protein
MSFDTPCEKVPSPGLDPCPVPPTRASPRQRPLLPVATPTLRSRSSGGEHGGSRSRHADFGTTRVDSRPACCSAATPCPGSRWDDPIPQGPPLRPPHTVPPHSVLYFVHIGFPPKPGLGFWISRNARFPGEPRPPFLRSLSTAVVVRTATEVCSPRHQPPPLHNLRSGTPSVAKSAECSACNNLSPQPTRGFSATGFAGKAQLT